MLALFNERAVESGVTQYYTTPEGTSIEIDSAGPWTPPQIYDILKKAGLDTRLGPTYRVKVQDVTASSTGASAQQSGGVYSNYGATSYLKGVDSNFAVNPEAIGTHEFGHAWTLYHLYMSQNGSWDAYLKERNLVGNPKLETSYAWSKSEMIAEDYRLLFGSGLAISQMPNHMNNEIPQPSTITGFKDWFTNTWAKAPVVPPPDPPPPGPQPTVPGTPTLSAKAAETSVSLTWTVPINGGSPITGYRLYRASTFLVAVTGTTTTYVDTGLAANTGYSYQVSAVNSVGEGIKSNPLAVTTLKPPPPAPVAILNALANPASFRRTTTISWSLSMTATFDATVYNTTGQIRALMHRSLPAGASSVLWDRLTDGGVRAAPGNYTVSLRAVDANGWNASVDLPVVVTK